MKNRSMKTSLGIATVCLVAIGSLSFTSGCKSQPAEKDANIVPAPSTQTPSAPAVTAPAVVGPKTNAAPLPPTPAIPDATAEVYTVKSGDSFSKIAKKYGVGVNELAAYNNMSIQKPLQIGAKLKIPPAKAK